MLNPRRIKAIICDHDGVLADTQKLHAQIESDIFAEHGITIGPKEITRRFSGVSGKDMFPQVFSEAGKIMPDLEELSRAKWDRMMRMEDAIEEISGSCDFIRYVSGIGYPLAVASASKIEFLELSLGRLGIRDCFHAVASSREVARGKPAPDVFLLAASRLGIDPKDCVVIEDGISGMIGAREAGMQVIALAEDMSRDYPADLVVPGFWKIPREAIFWMSAM